MLLLSWTYSVLMSILRPDVHVSTSATIYHRWMDGWMENLFYSLLTERPISNWLLVHSTLLIQLRELDWLFLVVNSNPTEFSQGQKVNSTLSSISYFFLNVGTPSGVHLFGHLLWPIFQSSNISSPPQSRQLKQSKSS